MAVTPRLIVDGNPRTALPFGLFSVLTPRADSSGLWQNGIEWETLSCAPLGGLGEPCPLPGAPGESPVEQIGLPKDIESATGGLGEAKPFTLYGTHSCSPVGNSQSQAEEKAMFRLLAREEHRAEQALWTGDLGNTGFAEDAVQIGSDGLKPSVAVGVLEKHLGDEYGSLGVLHMDRLTAVVLLEEGALRVSGNGLYSVLGTPVIAGSGYPGTAPDGSDPAEGNGLIYATPALIGYRSEPFVSSAFDQRTNDMLAVAERTYVLGFDPCGGVAYSSAAL